VFLTCLVTIQVSPSVRDVNLPEIDAGLP